jgi:hypothetical protein
MLPCAATFTKALERKEKNLRNKEQLEIILRRIFDRTNRVLMVTEHCLRLKLAV